MSVAETAIPSRLMFEGSTPEVARIDFASPVRREYAGRACVSPSNRLNNVSLRVQRTKSIVLREYKSQEKQDDAACEYCQR
jgi:hypothetical protein